MPKASHGTPAGNSKRELPDPSASWRREYSHVLRLLIDALIPGEPAPIEPIIAGEAGQRVVPCVACERVVQRVTGAVEPRGTSECEVLDLSGQRVGDTRLNEDRPTTRALGGDVARVVHDVRVVAS